MVVTAVRDKEAELLTQQEKIIDEIKQQCASQMETEKKRANAASEHRCVRVCSLVHLFVHVSICVNCRMNKTIHCCSGNYKLSASVLGS